MDAKQAQRVVHVVDSVVNELRRLRGKRMGSLSSARVLQELEAINSSVASGNGLLLREKINWFNHDLIEREIGNLKALMQTLQDCLQDSDVRTEIIEEGFSVPVTQFSLHRIDEMADNLRAVDDKHHKLIEKARKGTPVSAQELAEYEEFVLQLNDLEERIEAYATGALQEYKPYIAKLKKAPSAWLPRVAAGLILSVAAVGASMFGTAQAYAQETSKTAQKPQVVRTATIDDQISVLEAKPNKTSEEIFKLAELYENAKEFDKASATLQAYLENNPNDVLAWAQKITIDKKQRKSYPKPDNELNGLIDSIDTKKYRRWIESNNRRAITNEFEQLASKILSYDINSLNIDRKFKLSAILSTTGVSYDILGLKDQALVACELSISLIEQSPTAYSIIGKVNFERKEFNKALDAYKKVVEYAPKKPQGHAGIGYCYSDQGKYSEALPHFEKALQLAPSESHRREYSKEINKCKENLGR